MREILKLILITSSILFTQNLIAQDFREIYVNNQPLTQQEALLFDQLVGVPVPSGRYWLDLTTRSWGYGNNPPNQDTSSNPPEKKYWEDRMEDLLIERGGYDIPPIIYPQ